MDFNTFVEGLADSLVKIVDSANDYDERKIDRTEFRVGEVEVLVSTCFVADSLDPYETAICFGESFKVVETYRNPVVAKEGHDRWVSFIQTNQVTNLDNFEDQGTNFFAQILRELPKPEN